MTSSTAFLKPINKMDNPHKMHNPRALLACFILTLAALGLGACTAVPTVAPPEPSQNFSLELLAPSGATWHTTNAAGRIPFRLKFSSQFESGAVNQLTLLTNGATLFTTKLFETSLNAGEWNFNSNFSFSGARQGIVRWSLISSNWPAATVRSKTGSFTYSYRPQPVEKLMVEPVVPLNSKLPPLKAGSDTTVRVHWKAPAVHALGVGYELRWATNGTALQLVRTNAPLTHTNYLVPAKLGGRYDLKVTATNALGMAHYATMTLSGVKISTNPTPLPIYTVTFNTGGGSAVAETNIVQGGKVKKPTDPTRDRHTFDKWYVDAGLSTEFDFNAEVTNALTAYAKWERITYKVTFEMNGATPAVGEQNIKYSNTANKPTDPTLTGHTFGGWFTNAGFSGSAFDFSQGISNTTIFYAKWTRNSYKVTFELNGGSGVTAQNVLYTNEAEKPADPTLAGHTFENWYVNRDLSGSAFDFSTSITANRTLYAKWTRNTYTVTFNSGGGSGVAAQNVLYTNKATQPTAPTLRGFTFKGWFTTAATNTEFNFNRDITSPTTIYASWERNTYAVTFNSGGGSAVAAQNVLYTNKATRPGNPTREGHTFDKWYVDAGLSTEFDFNAEVTNALTAYAKWKTRGYSVTFITNVGDQPLKTVTVQFTNQVTKPAEPSRTGATFAGWFWERGLATAFNFDRDVIKSNTTLYAKWSTKTYQVTFNSGGGSAVNPQTIAHNDRVPKPSNPTRSGYAFLNWYTNGGYAGRVFNFDRDVITAATTLYARWIKTYAVRFATNGRGEPQSFWTTEQQTVRHGSNALKPASDPTRTGYTFDRWYKDAALTQSFNFGSDVITGATTLYAKWNIKTYKVTFITNVGDPVFSTKSVAYTNKATPPTIPTRTGYTFDGWYKDAALTQSFDFNSDVITAPITLYAKWRTTLSYQVTDLAVHYHTNFYGDKTQPTLTWKVAAGSTAARQEVWWGGRSLGNYVTNLSASTRSVLIPLSQIDAINGSKTYPVAVTGLSADRTITNVSSHSLTLYSCGAPQAGFTMVCSTNTLEGINAKGLGGNYRLQKDLDLAGKTYPRAIIAPDLTDLTAGGSPENNFNGTRFTGRFDGAGKRIVNGVIDGGGVRDYLGLFGELSGNAVVYHLGVALQVKNGDRSVGGVVGRNYGTISNVYATGAVSGREQVGGLVGLNTAGGTITHSYARGAVSGSEEVGGLSGDSSGTVSNVYATGAVNGKTRVGGVVGNSKGALSSAYATGAVSRSEGTSSFFGYVLGRNETGGTTNALFYRSATALPSNAANPGAPTVFDASATQAFFPTFDFTSVWQWSATLKRPVLRDMPTGAEQ